MHGEEAETREGMADQILSEVHAYWQSLLKGRAMPARTDLDPTDIPHLLPHLMLTDVLPDGRYRYRLVGTEVERRFGAPMTGRTLEELMFGDYLAYLTEVYRRVVVEKRPLYTSSRYGDAQGATPLYTRRLTLPLSDDGERVNMVLSAQVFRRAGAYDDRTAHALQHLADHEDDGV